MTDAPCPGFISLVHSFWSNAWYMLLYTAGPSASPPRHRPLPPGAPPPGRVRGRRMRRLRPAPIRCAASHAASCSAARARRRRLRRATAAALFARVARLPSERRAPRASRGRRASCLTPRRCLASFWRRRRLRRRRRRRRCRSCSASAAALASAAAALASAARSLPRPALPPAFGFGLNLSRHCGMCLSATSASNLRAVRAGLVRVRARVRDTARARVCQG